MAKLKERLIESNIKDTGLVKLRREIIIRAASKVFIEKGYHSATIRDICKASGIGPGTLYNYIRKKEDILYLIYSKLTTMIRECLIETVQNNNLEDPNDRLKKALRKMFDVIWDNQDLTSLMYRETASLDRESMHNILKRESDFVALFQNILSRKDKAGILNGRKELDADIITFLFGFIPLRRWNLKKRFNEDEIKSGLIDFVLRALGVHDVQMKRIKC
jgi:AcrR family transcriptional regulator